MSIQPDDPQPAISPLSAAAEARPSACSFAVPFGYGSASDPPTEWADDDDPASPGNEDRTDAATDPSSFLLAVPGADPPGSVYGYNSATAYAAGIVVAKATKQQMANFAQSALFGSLGITKWEGQGNLSITARGLATSGEMVRNEGRYRGRQIVSRPGCAQRLRQG